MGRESKKPAGKRRAAGLYEMLLFKTRKSAPRFFAKRRSAGRPLTGTQKKAPVRMLPSIHRHRQDAQEIKVMPLYKKPQRKYNILATRGYSVVYGGVVSVCRAVGICGIHGPLALFLCLARIIIILYFLFRKLFLRQAKPVFKGQPLRF
jgi:hypothetical protein